MKEIIISLVVATFIAQHFYYSTQSRKAKAYTDIVRYGIQSALYLAFLAILFGVISLQKANLIY